MTTLILATIAAGAYGASDFLGGLGGRRTSAWAVAVVGQATSAVVALGFALAVTGSPSQHALIWGGVGGIGGGVGAAFLYRGLALGRMGVVAPISAVGAAVVPVLVGVSMGSNLSILVWSGIALALPGIALAASEPGSSKPSSSTPSAKPADRTSGKLPAGVIDGVLAGLGFGFMFVALGEAEAPGVGLWPIVAAQTCSTLAALGLAIAMRQHWRPNSDAVRFGLAAGPLGALAVALFFLAAQEGELVIAAVLASLYPAATVALAAIVLKERLHRVQTLGLILCAAAVTLIAAG